MRISEEMAVLFVFYSRLRSASLLPPVKARYVTFVLKADLH